MGLTKGGGLVYDFGVRVLSDYLFTEPSVRTLSNNLVVEVLVKPRTLQQLHMPPHVNHPALL